MVSVAVSTTVVVSTMATYGVEPKLEAVNPEVATAFVAGLRWAFLMLGAALATGAAIAFYRALSNRSAVPRPPIAAEPQPRTAGND